MNQNSETIDRILEYIEKKEQEHLEGEIDVYFNKIKEALPKIGEDRKVDYEGLGVYCYNLCTSIVTKTIDFGDCVTAKYIVNKLCDLIESLPDARSKELFKSLENLSENIMEKLEKKISKSEAIKLKISLTNSFMKYSQYVK